MLAADDTALVVGTSKGEIVSWITPLSHMYETSYVSAGRMRAFGLADLADSLAGELLIGRGPRLTVSGACASGLHALIRAAMLIQSGEARRALVVAAEASVHPLFVGSFRRLGVLAAEGQGCRPFDQDRGGFLMSEAAAAVCLEASTRADSSRAPLADIDRFALGGDATHLTGGDPDARTLRRLLATVIDNRPVDLIHAHATGTVAHDPIELAAIESSVEASDHPPSVYSHKAALGHSLGAAGLVSVVLNCVSHQTGVIPGNVQTRRPIDAERVTIAREPVTRRVSRSVAVASGFGGSVGVVSLVG